MLRSGRARTCRRQPSPTQHYPVHWLLLPQSHTQLSGSQQPPVLERTRKRMLNGHLIKGQAGYPSGQRPERRTEEDLQAPRVG